MLRTMALLAAPNQNALETATAVGFDSVGSFTRAFSQFCGEPRPHTEGVSPALAREVTVRRWVRSCQRRRSNNNPRCAWNPSDNGCRQGPDRDRRVCVTTPLCQPATTCRRATPPDVPLVT
jgi:hypothetical protein